MWLQSWVDVPYLGEGSSCPAQGCPLAKSSYMEECLWLGGTLQAGSQLHELLKDKYSHDYVCCVSVMYIRSSVACN